MTNNSSEIGPPPLPAAVRQPAHCSTRPGRDRPAAFNADASGLSMNWKLAGGIVAFFLASGTLWTALGLAKVSDLSDHNQNGNAHQVILEPNTRPVPATHAMRKIYDAQKKHQDEYQELATKVDDGVDVIVTVRNGMYEDRAERLADRAADKIQNPRRSREVWKEVKEKALDNLARDRPIRDGLQRYLDYD